MATKAKTPRPLDRDARSKAERLETRIEAWIPGVEMAVELMRIANETISKACQDISEATSLLRSLRRTSGNGRSPQKRAREISSGRKHLDGRISRGTHQDPQ